MRPLYALAAAVSILGVVAIYMKFQASVARPPATVVEQTATGSFDVELTLTFDAGPDAFSLGGDSLLVTFRNRKLLEKKDPIAAGAPITIRDVQGIVARQTSADGDDAAPATGRNEFYVKATPAEADLPADAFSTDPTGRQPAALVSRAARVRILRDGVSIGDSTLWSEPGQPVEGVVTVEVEPEPVVDEREHD
jgi:hypothetical protein